ncbi:MAG: Leucine-tRNA ligase [Candidatus Wolfebacteria bacterium GW2011_GWE2_44_13]|uniref:Leucine--tRNA ligase n=1 Tax=Candidatus Wolfebacteria bacterium GW2011_GWE2_44_13 TaxID=1619017 RepID=A0A0G1H8G9_9BACT|nr:MAG: Leucine-tRNA ligase [Candidatus Wolfebacteria bacterium GW2011_GWE2_44_13]
MQFKNVEKKWRAVWEKEGIYTVKDSVPGKKNFYSMVMFPYPSGNLHIGHWYNFGPADVFARFKRMTGFNVFSPIGFDAFGLPAENAAIKNGIHPKTWTYKNIKTMTAQLEQMGTMYDWERRVVTADPEYYKWTQWMFLQLFHAGLAYRTKAKANWCPKDHTVLANEQVIDGKCDRCGTEVVQRNIDQWLFKITDYAERLLQDLEGLDWPEKTKTMQRNWIGKSEGVTINFPLVTSEAVAVVDTMKFNPSLVSLVLSGEKYISYRLEPKHIKVGDVCGLVHAGTKKQFALARITGVEKRTMGELSEQEVGHEKFANRKAMYTTYAKYYGKPVTNTTDVWVYTFECMPESVAVFTTRVDTIYGCTYVVVAPEHALIESFKQQIENYKAVATYVTKSRKKLERERIIEEKEKTGVRLQGVSAINPFTGESVPVFVADYVLGGYGTGAVMAVPAHDERDFIFAKQFSLPIKTSIVNAKKDVSAGCMMDDGTLVDSEAFTGMDSATARTQMTAWLEQQKMGAGKVNYKLRDWLISRQRYWGSPIPLVFCEHCKQRIASGDYKKGEFTQGELSNPGWVGVASEALPVLLPLVKEYLPTEDGKSPLAHSKSFMRATCSKCGGKGMRETDTMDTFVCSSWYYLRYPDPQNAKQFADKKKLAAWLPADMYVGGAEHSVLHLLYARFFTKALYDLKHVPFKEPFAALRHQGMILGPDGQKMSKSKGNVIDPDELVGTFGADAVRMYLCFMGPYDQGGAWQPGGMVGIARFLQRVESLYTTNAKDSVCKKPSTAVNPLKKVMHQTIKKVTEDIADFHFNTAISSLMILLNTMDEYREHLDGEVLEQFLLLLAPFAPYIAEELYREALGQKKSIHLALYPKYNPHFTVENEFDLVVQINGKVRDTIRVPKGITQERARELALTSKKVFAVAPGMQVRKVIFVPDRLINLVVEL